MGILVDMGLVVFVSSSLSAGAGAFLGSYLKKKGENLAIHEDITQLVDQVRAVTTTTKEIEAKISNEVWDRQKRWEMKRDAVFEAAKRVSLAYDAFSRLYAVYHTDLQTGRKDDPERIGERVRVSTGWNEAGNRLEEAALIVGLVSGVKLQNLFLSFSTTIRRHIAEIMNWQIPPLEAWSPDLSKQMAELYEAMGKELGT